MSGTVCRGCGATIRWAKTRNGTALPLDPEPTARGNVWLDELGVAHIVAAGAGQHVSHFATCPDAGRFRTGAA